MEDKPTVQMDSFSADDQGYGEGESSGTIPIDDMIQQQQPSWPSPPPPQYSTPSPPPPPPQQVTPPPFGPPAAQPAPAGATKVMGRPAPPSLLAWLAAVEGPGASRGQVFTLQRETVIGRAAGQVALPGDAYVSAEHAKIRMEPNEEDEEEQVMVLYDLASANGTFAGDRDGYRDNQIYRYVLKDGDFILIGETTLVFKKV